MTESLQTLTHFDATGQARMVDVGNKAETKRVARATGRITMLPETLTLIESGSHKKGRRTRRRSSRRDSGRQTLR